MRKMVGSVADGLARSGFDADLAYGQSRESAFVQAITHARIEVKSDQKAHRTRNVFVEIRQGSSERGKGRNSGLAITVAEWYVIEFEQDRFLVIRTSALKEIVRHVARERGTMMGGDGNRFEGVLVPLECFIEPSGIAP